ncbi:MAG: tRNA uridine-5-carboxymethylaminomethyl(34) synthesis GTPase MnmE [Desulfobacterales bacterium]|nr:tRNA uridine-5-carboxymethylaminomethyl(34) synthesis GTPase MnmE [Desulfobacterales bacterium]
MAWTMLTGHNQKMVPSTPPDTAVSGAETIAAIATPAGAGGIGIIRVSGPLAGPILSQVFRPHRPVSSFASHHMYYGWIVDPGTGSLLDEVLAVFMRAPHTYTREDVTEIHCHGSYLVLEMILALIFRQGARPARAGEFTKRAFLNGRIDLTRAEAVLELLQAKTGPALGLACGQLQGRLHDQVMAVRESLLAVRAVIEVAIDFPEEEGEILDPARMAEQLQQEVIGPITALLADADQGRIFRKGISAVILGRPNVGKSSLLNTLLREERALVTAIPGTTRDTIEEYVNIKGMPVRIIDTAGIRDTSETVEALGVRRARAKLAEADLVLLLLDLSTGLTPEDRQLYANIRENNGDTLLLVVLNKQDLVPDLDPGSFAADFPEEVLVPISAKNGDGIRQLEQAIFTAVAGQDTLPDSGPGCAPNLRHRAALAKALDACQRAAAGLTEGLPPDLLAVDLQATLDHLADIVGETTTEDVLDMIFERFCIGK